MAGYSKRSLADKLGIKKGFKTAVLNPPKNYFELLSPLPKTVHFLRKPSRGMNLIHFFTGSRSEYEKKLVRLKKTLLQDGALWVSWPKAASKVPTDMTENVVRGFALKNGLVDIKVCAVNDVWSGLKLVIPVKDRKKAGT